MHTTENVMPVVSGETGIAAIVNNMSAADIFWAITITLLMIGILVTIVGFLIVIPFSADRKNILMEIERSTGREKAYWRRELRKLYYGWIPIFGKLIVGKSHRHRTSSKK